MRAHPSSPRRRAIAIGRIAAICAVALASAISGFAQSSPTGNWTGTYTFTTEPVRSCQNKTYTSSGTVSATFLQTGAALLGRISLTNFLVFSGSSCTPAARELTSTVIGTVSGKTLTWEFPNDVNAQQFVGSSDGSTITAEISDVYGGNGTLVLSRTPAPAAPGAPANLTGNWSGTYAFSDRCNATTFNYSGTFALGLTQTGSTASGVMTLQKVPLYDQNCRQIASLDTPLATAGVVYGPTFTGAAFEPSGSFEFPVTATLTNGSLGGSVTGANLTGTTGTFTATQSSTAAPPSPFSGSYQGSYQEVDNESGACLNIGQLGFSGDAAVAVVQSGNAISAAIVFDDTLSVISDGFGRCAVVQAGRQVLPLYGTLSGSSVTLTLPLGGGTGEQFVVSFSESGLTGTMNDSWGDYASFDAVKTSAAPPPVVQTFTATPAVVTAGQAATLSWSTSNATAVSIDNGVGSEPASGTISVTPARTTTYTLTASSATGSTTATATVTVAPPGPRRRAAQR